MNGKKYYAHTKKGRAEEEWQELREHLIGVAEIAAGFVKGREYEGLFYNAGLMHDLGKYKSDFQRYLKEGGRRGSVPHAFIGAGYSRSIGYNEISFAIDGHHKGLPDRSKWKEDIFEYSEENYDFLQNTFIDDLKLDSGSLSMEMPNFNNIYERELFIRYIFSALTDADWLDTEKALRPELQDKRNQKSLIYSELITKIEEELDTKPKEGELNKLRNKVREEAIDKSNLEPGFFSLNLPTGMGKTLTSVLWALKHAEENKLKRIIIVLPFINIIDQTAKILKGIFSDDMVLEHHSGNNELVNTDEDINDNNYEQRLACENWDYPLIVTTTVQFFESIFSNRPSRCRKIHNIAESVVVFDEVQTLPKELISPTLKMLININVLMRTSFLFCTATQPAFEKREGFEGIDNITPLVEEPEILFKSTIRVHYTVLNDNQPLENEDLILEAEKQGTSALFVFNTKRAALEYFKQMSKSKSWNKMYHLSTAMCPHHRKKTITEISEALKNNEKICVSSTQLIEAGVDFDFPCVFREIAPLESIIQAAGRCNREWKKEKGNVFIFRLNEARSPDKLYKSSAEAAMDMILENINRLHDHDFFGEYYKKVISLFVDADKKNINEAREKFKFKTVAESYHIIDKPNESLFIRNYNEESERIYSEIEGKEFITRNDYRKIQEYSVQVYTNFMIQNHDNITERIKGFKVWQGLYDDNTGITTDSLTAEQLVI